MKWFNLDKLDRIASVQSADSRIFAALHKIPKSDKCIVSIALVGKDGSISTRQIYDYDEASYAHYEACASICA